MEKILSYLRLAIYPLIICSVVIQLPGKSFAQSQSGEYITITTYYPSPMGSYNNLSAAGILTVGRYNAVDVAAIPGIQLPGVLMASGAGSALILVNRDAVNLATTAGNWFSWYTDNRILRLWTPVNHDLLGIDQDGNVGVGTTNPHSPAPNNLEGNLDVNDVYLRSTGQWVSEGGSGVSYTHYCFTSSNYGTPVCTNFGGARGYCPSGCAQKKDLGTWGYCRYDDISGGVAAFFLPPGGVCGTGCAAENGAPLTTYVGHAYVCACSP